MGYVMAETVKLPGIGPVDKKWVYVGGAAIAGIVGYAYWTNRSAKSAEVSDYTTEPEADYAMDSSVDEYVNPGGSSAPIDTDNNAAPTTNTEWSAQASEYLIDHGYEPKEVIAAMGAYFLRMKLSTLHAEIIRAAHGRFGPPPSGTYPIESSPTPTTPAPTVPKLTAPTGLSAHDIGSTHVGLLWNAVSGARYYEVLLPGGPTTPLRTASTQLWVRGLKRNTRYAVRVRAYDMNKQTGPWSTSRTFTTKK